MSRLRCRKFFLSLGIGEKEVGGGAKKRGVEGDEIVMMMTVTFVTARLFLPGRDRGWDCFFDRVGARENC